MRQQYQLITTMCEEIHMWTTFHVPQKGFKSRLAQWAPLLNSEMHEGRYQQSTQGNSMAG
eukprot:230361-Amphidinium_carterae.1